MKEIGSQNDVLDSRFVVICHMTRVDQSFIRQFNMRPRVGRWVKKKFWHYFFVQKCVFYACFTLIGSCEGRKNFRVGIF